ncbi:MAG: holo [Thiomonas sp. 13-66-29]|jgi:acyl carrier protein|nr:MAG: holo [Thiomonas sp. 13-66-29]
MSIVQIRGLDQIRHWLESRNKEGLAITADLDLIEARLVDSLSFVEFIYTISEASGNEIDPENLDIENLKTLRAIENTYF